MRNKFQELQLYGVIVIEKIDNLEKAPPDIVSIKPTRLPVADFICEDNANASTPGTVIKQPNLNITINISVYNNFFLTSGVFNAFLIVLNN